MARIRTDIVVRGKGMDTVISVTWTSPRGREWIMERLGGETHIESRYIDDILDGMKNDGLVVRDYAEFMGDRITPPRRE